MDDVTGHLRLGLAIVMLLGASVSDLKTRRVRNQYWFPFLGLTAVFVVGDLLADWSAAWVGYTIATGLCLLWYMVWRLGAFGGADAKGLMILSFLLVTPFEPLLPLPPTLDAVANGSLMVLLLPVAYLGLNLGRGRLKLPAAVLGTTMALDAAPQRKVWPMQRASDDGLRWQYRQKIGEPLDDVYAQLRQTGVKEVWVTPQIPFIVPILVGMLVSAFYGNLPLLMMQQILGN